MNLNKPQPEPPPRASDEAIELDFKDGHSMRFVYNEVDKEGLNLDHIALYRNKRLKAFDSEKTTYDGFLSTGNVSQQELAGYWNAALELAEGYLRKYEKGEIGYKQWCTLEYMGFWIIAGQGFSARIALERGIRRFVTRKPVRIKDAI